MKHEANESKYNLDDLLLLMSRLRDKESGCPWDCQQNMLSLVQHTLEEAYEVVDAIERGDKVQLFEELGDLLFQIVFYAQLGAEEGEFNFADIVHRLVSKLVSRHPHVFPNGTLNSRRQIDMVLAPGEINKAWEQKKHLERGQKGYRHILADIPMALPSLSRAEKIQKRVAKVGFDWQETDGVMDKVQEELLELRHEMHHGEAAGIEEEIGDLFFSLVNLSRHLGVNAELALRRANIKFEKRFSNLEDLAKEMNHALEELSDEQFDGLWKQVKSSSKDNP